MYKILEIRGNIGNMKASSHLWRVSVGGGALCVVRRRCLTTGRALLPPAFCRRRTPSVLTTLTSTLPERTRDIFPPNISRVSFEFLYVLYNFLKKIVNVKTFILWCAVSLCFWFCSLCFYRSPVRRFDGCKYDFD